MTSINSNLPSLRGQHYLSRNQASLSTAMERLTSGMRINGAKDDAAGQAIANRMTANLRGNDTVTRGVNDAISLLQTAEGGLDSINDLVQRAHSLAVQAANGTLSDANRAAINSEYGELRADIDRIALRTEVFGKHLLAPAESHDQGPSQPGQVESLEDIEVGKYYQSGMHVFLPIPVGTTHLKIALDDLGINDDLQLFTQDGKHLVGTPLGQGTWLAENNDSLDGTTIDGSNIAEELFGDLSKFAAGATYDDSQLNTEGASVYRTAGEDGAETEMHITYSGDRNAQGMLDEVLEIDEVTEPLLLVITGGGSFQFREVTWDQQGEERPPSVTSQGVQVVTGARVGQGLETLSIEPTPADHASLGLAEVELDPLEKALEAIDKLQDALSQVNEYRGRYGALHNRFESVVDGLTTDSMATAAAQSRLTDANYAQEASAMVKAQILQQAGMSVLGQVNQAPQRVLSLLE